MIVKNFERFSAMATATATTAIKPFLFLLFEGSKTF
jgi:hypothetical protein